MLAAPLSPHADPASFRDLMAAHGGYVRRLLRSLGIREADLPDLCQETFLVVHRRLPSFEGRSSLRTWIAGIVVRLASDYRDKAHRRHEYNTDEPPEVSVEPGQQGWLEWQELWSLARSVLDALPSEQRAVFTLHELENQPMLEIALRMNCPLSTAYARLQAARRAVRASKIGLTHCPQGSPRCTFENREKSMEDRLGLG